MITLLGDNMSIQEYLKTKTYNPGILSEKNLFEWELAIQYGIMYQKHVRGEIVQELQNLENDHNLIINCGVPEEMVKYIELFCELDKEYKDRIIAYDNSPLRQPILKKDLEWRGFWLKVTGNDFSVFIHWIKSGIKNEIYRTQTFMDTFIQEHKNIKSPSDIPYAVKCADQIFRKYYIE